MPVTGGLYSLDTAVLIWEVRGTSGDEPEENQRRAQVTRERLAELRTNDAQFVVAPHALTEFLVPYEPSQIGNVIRELRENRIHPLSPSSLEMSIATAPLLRRYFADRAIDGDRDRVKFDMMIIAESILSNVDTILTWDRVLQDCANRFAISEGGQPLIDVELMSLPN